MTYGEKAVELKKSLNCAQSVAVALDGLTGLDEGTAKAASSAFGGGLRCGEACGACSGAVLALGLAIAKDGDGRPGSTVGDAAAKLTGEFKEKFGAIRCADLMKLSGRDKSVCSGFCSWCADRAAELIEEAK